MSLLSCSMSLFSLNEVLIRPLDDELSSSGERKSAFHHGSKATPLQRGSLLRSPRATAEVFGRPPPAPDPLSVNNRHIHYTRVNAHTHACTGLRAHSEPSAI